MLSRMNNRPAPFATISSQKHKDDATADMKSHGLSLTPSEPVFDTSSDSAGSDIDSLLEDASEVARQTVANFLMPKPTPISQDTTNIRIVDQVPVTAASWFNDESLSSSIYFLLVTAQEHSNSTTHQMSIDDGDDSIVPYRTSQDSNCKDQTERWNERYQDLVEFHRTRQHCLVPSTYPCNPPLGHWVKRQRYQYNLKINGCHSTLTTEREEALEKLGFVWDSHAAIWEERCNELRLFQESHGHCHVPRRYLKNPKLPIWIKCQRRQYKLFASGKATTMTQDRIDKLQSIGFVLNPRCKKRRQS